ncbi:hypothetical protein HY091_01435 [Candidatus Kaiserbacteria bacterium]|nr:hypothetical protein [Candidatus Kaiserbacteria bacterium]
MIYRHEHRGGVWVDIERPTNEEIRQVAREFSIGERLETELLSPTPLPLVAGDTDFVLLVLHFPAQGEQDGETKNQEVDFVVGKRFVLTIRYEVVAPIHRLRKLLETQELVGGGASFSNDTLLEILFAHLFGAVRDHANHIAARLSRIERDMFGGHERDTVRDVSLITREFLHLEAALVSQEEPLGRFLKMLASRGFFETTFGERVLRINAERSQVARLAGTHRAVATELRETNAVLLEARQNEVMKTLTVISFIVLPLELITFTFGMGVPGTPLVNNPNAFWIILAIMLATVACMAFFFTRKRWLA